MNVSLARIHVIRERASEQKALAVNGVQVLKSPGSFASLGAAQIAEAPV